MPRTSSKELTSSHTGYVTAQVQLDSRGRLFNKTMCLENPVETKGQEVNSVVINLGLIRNEAATICKGISKIVC